MTLFHDGREFDFQMQLDEAQKKESKLRDVLSDAKIELKTERNLWHDSGNIVIEYESHDKPSGIAATQADYWTHELCTKKGKTLAYLMFPMPILRRICNDLMDDEVENHWRRGGEGKNMEMILLELNKIFERLSEIACELDQSDSDGDERFFTRRERFFSRDDD